MRIKHTRVSYYCSDSLEMKQTKSLFIVYITYNNINQHKLESRVRYFWSYDLVQNIYTSIYSAYSY